MQRFFLTSERKIKKDEAYELIKHYLQSNEVESKELFGLVNSNNFLNFITILASLTIKLDIPPEKLIQRLELLKGFEFKSGLAANHVAQQTDDSPRFREIVTLLSDDSIRNNQKLR